MASELFSEEVRQELIRIANQYEGWIGREEASDTYFERFLRNRPTQADARKITPPVKLYARRFMAAHTEHAAAYTG